MSEQIGGLDLSRCAACQGIFLNAGQLAVITQDGNPATIPEAMGHNEDSDDTPLRSCPDCRVMMQPTKSQSSKVVLDVCPQCHGLWLDQGELSQIDAQLDQDPIGHLDVAALRLKTLSSHMARRGRIRSAEAMSEFDKDRAAVLELEAASLLGRLEVLAMLREIDRRASQWKARTDTDGPMSHLKRLLSSGLIDDSQYRSFLDSLSDA